MCSGFVTRKPSLAAAALIGLLALPVMAYGQQTVEVVIQNYRYQPQVVRIKAGDTVRWVNREKRTSHSVVFPVDQGGESERFFPDESWQRRFDVPGRYSYHCGPHPEMTGVIEVSDP
ncbi:plastocyanin/azurin family copper-binding protein [Rhodoferax sp.]|uniref:cupredoxin domain-containing protein n=1 Tax=Rhodoferax sp. TaxID=50421 RepID=UPI00275FAA0C|nr:cupredoxin domain-containing protein [Rhodoferax sp.]